MEARQWAAEGSGAGLEDQRRAVVRKYYRGQAADPRTHALAGELRDVEERLFSTTKRMGAVVDYAKTRPVFDGYKAARYSKKYLAEHEEALASYRAAQQEMREAAAVKANVDHLLVLSDGRENKAQERERRGRRQRDFWTRYPEAAELPTARVWGRSNKHFCGAKMASVLTLALLALSADS